MGFINNRQELLLMVVMCFFYFVEFLAFSCIAPFLPIETKIRGIDEMTTGILFAVYPFVMVIVCPIVGALSPKVGLRITFLVGSLFLGINQIIFAFAKNVGDGFLPYCFVFRILIALCAALCETTGYSILAIVFRERIATVFGISELFTGLGFLLGPVLGGGLYSIGGFKCIFIVMGILAIAFTILAALVLPSESELDGKAGKDESAVPVSTIQILRIPAVALLIIVLVFVQTTSALLEPTLGYHLQDITNNGITPFVIGLAFMSYSVLYGSTTPFIGYAIDKRVISGRCAIIVGMVISVLAFLMIGVPSFLIFPRKLWVVMIGLAISGFALAFFFGALYSDVAESARQGGVPDCVQGTSLITGIFTGFYNSGSVIGPSLGGFLAKKYNFSYVCTGVSIGFCTLTIILIVFTIFQERDIICGIRSTIKKRKASYKIMINEEINNI